MQRATNVGGLSTQTTFRSSATANGNCGRGMSQPRRTSVVEVFSLGGRARVEAIGEIFNLLTTSTERLPGARQPDDRCSGSRAARPTTYPATSVVRNSASASSRFGSAF